MGAPTEQEKIHFVEEMTLKLEETSLPPIACQILSWLMICKPVYQSFSDLTKNLQISKASVSNMTRLLIQMSLIEKVRIQGERQIHFQLKKQAWTDILKIQAKQVSDLAEISGKGVDLFSDDPEITTGRLEEMHRFYSFLADEMPVLIEKYYSQKDSPE